MAKVHHNHKPRNGRPMVSQLRDRYSHGTTEHNPPCRPEAVAEDLWREMLQAQADAACTSLGAESAGRVNGAVALVLTDKVRLVSETTADVQSQDNPDTWYLVNERCTCTDFRTNQAPEGWCKHRLARGILIRALQAVTPVEQPAAPAPQAPAAPAPTPQVTPEVKPAPYLADAPVTVEAYVQRGKWRIKLLLRGEDEALLMDRMYAELDRLAS